MCPARPRATGGIPKTPSLSIFIPPYCYCSYRSFINHYKYSVELASQHQQQQHKIRRKIMKSFLPKSKSELLLWQMLVFMILAVGSSLALEVNGSDGVAAPREFDYFKLALQWPGTACQRTRHCCSSNACCRGYSCFSFIFVFCFHSSAVSTPFIYASIDFRFYL